MPRELRARTSRPNYAAAIGDAETNPSRSSLDGEEDSGSDFAPDKLSGDPIKDSQSAGEDLLEVDKEAPKRSDIVGLKPLLSRSGIRHKRPPKIQSAQTRPSTSIMSTTPRIAKMYALPNPSVHHRHRAIPVYLRKETVERLDNPPKLFSPLDVVQTNSMTSECSLTDRISRAWGYNVGPGPVWNITEDRSCFKEALQAEENPEFESCRRPRVHQAVTVNPGWTILNE